MLFYTLHLSQSITYAQCITAYFNTRIQTLELTRDKH
jgi:hypothetical protein